MNKAWLAEAGHGIIPNKPKRQMASVSRYSLPRTRCEWAMMVYLYLHLTAGKTAVDGTKECV